jgi:hypothetical protein
MTRCMFLYVYDRRVFELLFECCLCFHSYVLCWIEMCFEGCYCLSVVRVCIEEFLWSNFFRLFANDDTNPHILHAVELCSALKMLLYGLSVVRVSL